MRGGEKAQAKLGALRNTDSDVGTRAGLEGYRIAVTAGLSWSGSALDRGEERKGGRVDHGIWWMSTECKRAVSNRHTRIRPNCF